MSLLTDDDSCSYCGPMDYLNCDIEWDDDVFSAIDEAPLWSVPFGEMLTERVRMRENLVVMDVGTGTGYPLVWMAGMLGPTATLFGLDPSAEGLRRTRFKTKISDYSNVHLLRGAAESIPLGPGAVDLVISNNGFNNVQDLNASLAEARRVSKSGAQLVTTINLGGTMLELYSVLVDVMKAHGIEDANEKVGRHIDSKRPPLPEFIRAAESSGFVIKELQESCFSWRYLNGTAMLSSYSIRLAFLSSWKELVPEGLVRPVFTDIEKQLNAVAKTSGAFKLTVPFVCIDAEAV